MRCPPLYRKNTKRKENRKVEKRKKVVTIEKEKIIR